MKLACAMLNISLKESQKSLFQFHRIQDLFTRSLKSEYRPIHDGNRVSPCDGKLQHRGDITADGNMSIKGQDYKIDDFCGEHVSLEGEYFSIYLSPKDCHQFFMPMDCILETATHIPGACLPVNPLLESLLPRLYTRNERVVLTCKAGDTRFYMVMVAALNVGKIVIDGCKSLQSNALFRRKKEVFTLNRAYKKGEKCGQFMLGSTIVLCFPRNWSSSIALKKDDLLRYGQLL